MSEEKLAPERPLKETGKAIVHDGRNFWIMLTDDPYADSPYVLRPVSGRGPDYALLRNVPDPSMLYGVAMQGRLRVLPGWVKEMESGELKSLT